MTSGLTSKMTAPPIAPKISDSRMNFFAYSDARSSLFSPIALPIIIAVAFPIPNTITVASCLVTCATEFAATALLPRCPTIAALAE